jgi:hypothetical protein
VRPKPVAREAAPTALLNMERTLFISTDGALAT